MLVGKSESFDRRETVHGILHERLQRCLLDSYSQCLSYGRERWIVGQGECGPFPNHRRWLDGLSNGGGEVLRALMFPRQETPSPSCTLYLFACSPIFIRLYLRLESVPLHFLLKSSSFSSPPPSPPTATAVAAFYLFPSGYRCGDNNMQTFWYLQFECRKTGTESRDGTARGGPLNFSKTQPRVPSSLFY